ncbi:DoxX family protein [Sphingomonas sp. ST-64]|uniref:DoxX family protein n=1 Tax=Sphingomonas plantiphila TaxID=3163295 RepID=A0ABW8YKH5_9SPHN
MARSAHGIARIVALLLALAFAFFGYFKTFASLSVLAQHHAWTLVLPVAAGRLVGVTELVAALALLLGAIAARWHRVARGAAIYLIVNQACAAAVHLARGETAALPQNAVLAALAAFVGFALAQRQAR